MQIISSKKQEVITNLQNQARQKERSEKRTDYHAKRVRSLTGLTAHPTLVPSFVSDVSYSRMGVNSELHLACLG